MVLLLVASILPAGHAEPETWFYEVDDPSGDVELHCETQAGIADITKFEASNTADTFYYRFTVDDLGFSTTDAAAGVAFTLQIDGVDGNAYQAQVQVTADSSSTLRFDSDTRTDVPGLDWDVDRSGDTFTGWFPLASIGAAAGDAVPLPLAKTPYFPAAGLLWWASCDDVPVEPYVVQEIQTEAPPVRAFENLTGAAPEIDLSFANETTGTFTYNWTQNLTAIDVFVDGSAHNGTANMTITDGANATVLEERLLGSLSAGNGTENGTANQTGAAFFITDAAPGNWTIVVELDAFVGELRLRLAEHQPPRSDGSEPGTDTGPGDGTADSAEVHGNATGNGAAGSDQESPGAGIALLGALVTAVAMHRRRQRP